MGLFSDNARAIGSKIIIPAGGENVLGGPSAHLSQFQPLPSPNEFLELVDSDIAENIRLLYSLDTFDLEQREINLNKSFQWRNWTTTERQEYALSTAQAIAAYQELGFPSDIPVPWSRLLVKCRNNFLKKVQKMTLSLSYKIKICALNEALPKEPVEFEFETCSSPQSSIEFHLDQRLLFLMIVGALNWNNIESSGLIKMKRTPDEYNADLHFSLVFFSL